MQEHDRFGAARGSAASEQCNGHKAQGAFVWRPLPPPLAPCGCP
jgi:hypothetical protein